MKEPSAAEKPTMKIPMRAIYGVPVISWKAVS